MSQRGRLQPFLFETFLYAMAYLLLLEWIYPLEQIAELQNVAWVAGFAGFCFFVSILHMRWWMSSILKVAGMIFTLQQICFDGAFLQLDWVGKFIQELTYNVQVLLSNHWQDLTPLFRVLLILILIWLMSYLLHYWFVLMKRVLFFVAATIIYVSLLSTFLDYPAQLAIVRVFAISLISLGLANLLKTVDKEVVAFPTMKQMGKALLVLAAVLVVALAVGLGSPRYKPQWDDPVPHMKKVAEQAMGTGNGVLRRVGYGEDDTKLGGSFVQDYTPVFKTVMPTENYWRIETKDFYTGKGWERSITEPLELQPDGKIDLRTVTQSQKHAASFHGEVTFTDEEPLDKLIYPYGIESVKAAGADFRLEPISESIHIEKDGKPASLEKFRVAYNYPIYDVKRLQQDQNHDPQAMQILYTQLPDELPNRVIALAEKVAGKAQNRYDKAKAIEQYFAQNGFRYETVNVPVPTGEKDYVDQFLFDSKIGYCDNYSTAMVVMLRANGIPARWVKGFTSGDRIGQKTVDGKEYGTYEVTNANAHSWVEVYFPETGWVPFEPTQGFSNLADFQQPQIDQPGLNATDKKAAEKQAKAETQAQAPAPAKKEAQAAVKAEKPADAKAKTNVSPVNWIISGISLAVVVIAGGLIYRYRWHLRTARFKRKLQQDTSLRMQEQAYAYLLRLLAYKGLAKKRNETLRAFAIRVDQQYGMKDMQQLTVCYEQLIYSGTRDKQKDPAFRSQWELVVCRIMA